MGALRFPLPGTNSLPLGTMVTAGVGVEMVGAGVSGVGAAGVIGVGVSGDGGRGAAGGAIGNVAW